MPKADQPKWLDAEFLKAVDIMYRNQCLKLQKLYEDFYNHGLLGTLAVHYNTQLRLIKDNR